MSRSAGRLVWARTLAVTVASINAAAVKLKRTNARARMLVDFAINPARILGPDQFICFLEKQRFHEF
jgi:hypothetical protein